MTLKTQIASDRDDVFLNEDEFAESVTYYPVLGEGVDLVVLWEGEGQLTSGEDRIDQDETALVFIGSDVNSSKGGVNTPAIGDTIERNDSIWSFTGDTEDLEDDGGWFRFRRKTTRQTGTENRLS